MTYSVLIGLSAVMVAIEDDAPLVLVSQRDTGEDALPFGPFDPERHRTIDLSLRGWVREQTGFEPTPGSRPAGKAGTAISRGKIIVTGALQ